jgi:hypothetical protein
VRRILQAAKRAKGKELLLKIDAKYMRSGNSTILAARSFFALPALPFALALGYATGVNKGED